MTSRRDYTCTTVILSLLFGRRICMAFECRRNADPAPKEQLRMTGRAKPARPARYGGAVPNRSLYQDRGHSAEQTTPQREAASAQMSRFDSKMKSVAKIACLAVLLCCGSLTLGAQSAAPSLRGKTVQTPSTSPATFKVDVDLVLVEVGVHDEHGRAVGNLTREDFRVFEDGKEQEIAAFSHE